MRWGRGTKTTIIATVPLLLAGCNMGSLFHRHDANATAVSTTPQALTLPTTASAPATPQFEKRFPRLTDRAAGSDDAGTDVKDVWDRLRLGLRLETSDQPMVQKEIEWFRQNQEFLDRTAERARPYLYYIVAELEKRRMPLDLALLPIVESAFQPTAYSRHKAAGIWQFIPATGKRFGLKQNQWYDGRRDVMASTQAALDYLQQLHDEMDGDWLNAIAAYNCGEKKLLRAIEQNRQAGKPTDFWSLNLPKETKGYVPRLLAMSAIARSPLRHGVALQAIPNQPHLATVDVGGQVDLARAADLAGLSLDEMRALNPGFLKRVTDPNGPHRLVVPVSKAQDFEHAVAEGATELAVKGISHRVRTGESLAGLAARYGVSVEDIRSANAMTGRRLKAGQELVIPGGAAETLVAKAEPPAEGDKVVHTVQAGDNLWTIARDYQVSVNNLARWNGIAPGEVLSLRQKLVIWTKAAADAPKAVKTSAAITAEAAIQLVKYEIQDGDSLWTIARRFQVSVDQLCMWNRMPRHTVLQPGENLDVYVGITGLPTDGLQI